MEKTKVIIILFAVTLLIAQSSHAAKKKKTKDAKQGPGIQKEVAVPK